MKQQAPGMDSAAGLGSDSASAGPKDPRKVAAGRSRRPWSAEDRQRLRQQCLARQPWRHSTGPRTPQGKAQAAANGRGHHPRPGSRRQLKAEVSDVHELVAFMAKLRRSLDGGA